jgi:hypothetical protein
MRDMPIWQIETAGFGMNQPGILPFWQRDSFPDFGARNNNQ